MKTIKIHLISTILFLMPVFSTAHAVVTLRLHHMFSPQNVIHSEVLIPWAEKIEAESEGKLKVELFHSLQLGGKPAEMIDQVQDGVVDITWTLFGYTPGRFPKTEAFELPFVASDATSSSMAFQVFFNSYMRNDREFNNLHVLAVHTHGPGILHTRDKPITRIEDMNGLKLRGPSRVVNAQLMSLGAQPVPMPLIAIKEALSKSIINGTVIPFIVAQELNIPELAPYHTEFFGDRSLYTGTFIFAMNEKRYRDLPADLKQVIDNNSGLTLAKTFGQAMDKGDLLGRMESEGAGNTIIKLSQQETDRWHTYSEQLLQEWFDDMSDRGFDGKKYYNLAKKLIKSYEIAR